MAPLRAIILGRPNQQRHPNTTGQRHVFASTSTTSPLDRNSDRGIDDLRLASRLPNPVTNRELIPGAFAISYASYAAQLSAPACKRSLCEPLNVLQIDESVLLLDAGTNAGADDAPCDRRVSSATSSGPRAGLQICGRYQRTYLTRREAFLRIPTHRFGLLTFA